VAKNRRNIGYTAKQAKRAITNLSLLTREPEQEEVNTTRVETIADKLTGKRTSSLGWRESDPWVKGEMEQPSTTVAIGSAKAEKSGLLIQCGCGRQK